MRSVSLCPSITKLIFDLGAGDGLVAVTRFCVHPREALAHIPRVGGTKNPDIKAIAALKPDLVFLNREENRAEDWDALQNAGIACHVSYPITLAETEQTVREIGAALGRDRQAESLIDEIGRARARLKARAARFAGLSWAYLIWRKPWMAASDNTYIHHLIAEAGGRNIFSGREQLYPEITAAELAQAKPDAVLLSSEPFPFKQKHIRELSDLCGLPPQGFYLVDGELLSWHGALTARGLDYVGELMERIRSKP